jgi:hypothetical protein
MAARPDMTAHWESVLTQISEKQCRYQDFMQPLVGTLYQLIEQARSTPVRQFRGIVAPGGAKRVSAKVKPKLKRKTRSPLRTPPRKIHKKPVFRNADRLRVGRPILMRRCQVFNISAGVSVPSFAIKPGMSFYAGLRERGSIFWSMCSGEYSVHFCGMFRSR